MLVDVLGTQYDILFKDECSDTKLKERDGYTDPTIKVCVIDNMEGQPGSKENLSLYRNSVVRHELIHAFLEESGLSSECEWATEEMIDWMAIQFPKIMKAFTTVGVEK